jgi:hypothetical protein
VPGDEVRQHLDLHFRLVRHDVVASLGEALRQFRARGGLLSLDKFRSLEKVSRYMVLKQTLCPCDNSIHRMLPVSLATAAATAGMLALLPLLLLLLLPLLLLLNPCNAAM